MRGDPAEQQLLQVRLVEHVGLRDAVHPGGCPAELGHDLMPRVEQPEAAARPGAGQEVVADAGPVQDAGDLVVQVHRARQRVRRRVAFQHDDTDPGVCQQQRGRRADRPGANHDDRQGLPRVRPGRGPRPADLAAGLVAHRGFSFWPDARIASSRPGR